LAKKSVAKRHILKGHTEIHPALDFYNDKAIVSVARPGITTYDDESSTFEQYPVCIVSDGDTFILTTKELLERKLFYLKELDIALDRWEIEDQEKFVKQLKNGNKPDVSIPQIHNELKTFCNELFDFSDNKLYDFFPIFIIYTYFFPLFESAPVLHLWGPAGSGKTKIMELLSLTCFNPITSGNITEASVFRLVEGRRAVCLLDESEDLSKTERGRAITNLILNGYRRGNQIYRMDKVGRSIHSSHYDVYSPKVIANITGIDREALTSRAIRVMTNSTRNSDKANRCVAEIQDKAKVIRDNLYKACLTKFGDVANTKEEVPDIGLVGRSAEIWQGVLTVAWMIGDEVWHNVSWLAKDSAKAMERELIVANPIWDLLSALLNLVVSDSPDFYSNQAVWNCLERHACGEFISKQQVTDLLRRNGIASRIKWENKRTIRGFIMSKKQIEKKLSYLTSLATSTTLHPSIENL